MDLLTQGIFGSLWAMTPGTARGRGRAATAGFLAGMAPDLDALIRSPDDALLFIDYHRHFTHAIPFAPVGALVVALLLWPLLGRGLGFPRLYLYCFLGFLSHGQLDACTSYGTHLWWPFSDERVALNWISIVDPLFTLPVAGLLVLALVRRRRLWQGLAAGWAVLYLGLAGLQHHLAEERLLAWAAGQGIAVERHVIKPAFANLVLWRGVLEEGDRLQAVAVRQLPGGGARIYPGATVEKLRPADVAGKGRLGRELGRFAAFSDAWLFRYRPQEAENRWFVGDFRYALDPASDRPMWGIHFDPRATDEGVAFQRLGSVDPEERRRFMARLWGKSP